MIKKIKYYFSLKRKIVQLESDIESLTVLLEGIQQSIKDGRIEQIRRRYGVEVTFE